VFDHPSLGDFAYGQTVFCSADGKHQVWINAFSDFPQRVSALLGAREPEKFWHVLASLADGEKWTAKIICPHCLSDRLDYHDGQKQGVISLAEATFTQAANVDDSLLLNRINAAMT
jgi:hypothetical protein